MTKQVFFYVRADDCIWKFSRPEMKKQLKKVVDGGEFDLDAGRKVAEWQVRIEDINETGYANECLRSVEAGDEYL
tara:strand:+ start:6817 stop:7041 length:225 start_codon:yes stop_codon:yes gene_type:complete